MPDQPNRPNPWRLAGMGLEFAGAVLVLGGIGYLIDRWLGSEPWGMLAGTLLGFAGAMYNLIREALNANR